MYMGNNQEQVYLVHLHSKTGACSNQVKTHHATYMMAEWTSCLIVSDNGTSTTEYGY